MFSTILSGTLSFFTGLFNALFGSGGGIIAVSLLKNKGLEQKNSQATAMVLTFVLSLMSCVYYLYKGYFILNDALIYLPFGIVGALVGSILLKKCPNKILRKLFAVFIIRAGLKMIFR